MIFQSAINISHGTDKDIIEAISNTADTLVDAHIDRDHNRSVLTLLSDSLDSVVGDAKNIVDKSFSLLDIRDHQGVHPRLGVVDVVPFVMYEENNYVPNQELIIAVQSFGSEISKEYGIPIFFYDYASKTKQSLPQVRKHAYIEIKPDIGPDQAHEKFGAICVSAREPMVALNINLESDNLAFAKSIAKKIRYSSGGIPGVRAIGLELVSQKMVQVSMNIVDINVDIDSLCEQIIKMADEKNIISHIELVGIRHI